MRALVPLPLVLASFAAAAPCAGQAPATPAPLHPNPKAPLYRHVGEQYRVYDFPGTGESIPS